jgi:hypothetical protein
MEVKKFQYRGSDGQVKLRELVVTEESDKYIAGYDMSVTSDARIREEIEEFAENVSEEKFEEWLTANKANTKRFPFRKFKKSGIVQEV